MEARPRLAEVFLAIIEWLSSAEPFYNLKKTAPTAYFHRYTAKGAVGAVPIKEAYA
ncbi:hypothetical protein [Paenibacillus sp. S02]|uniref:hypothetical protein n=1 Tax=Paenibacillus sp. S02 TaxID=2823904 RepID=UPI001C649EBE|nr:hypothetical protein [Paenibacillus sp. S02]QYK66701.1 hypothetical protein KAI36_01847 [Paenibacillus sp. S02]